MMYILLLFGCVIGITNGALEFESDEYYIPYINNPAYTRPNPAVGIKLLKWDPTTSRQNPEELGTYYEGDIILEPSHGRTILKNKIFKWPAGIVPVEFSTNFTIDQIKFMITGLTYLHQRTCIRFVTKQPWHTNWVTVTADATGCHSTIGRKTVPGPQTINLQANVCINQIGTTIHEFMHTLGFVHEHTRWDRDTYITLNFSNLDPSALSDFNKYTSAQVTAMNLNYDYDSVMHYSAFAGSVVTSVPTITPNYNAPFMGQRIQASASDILKINRWYECTTTTLPGSQENFPLESKFNVINIAPTLRQIVNQYLYQNQQVDIAYPIDNFNLVSETQADTLIDVDNMFI